MFYIMKKKSNKKVKATTNKNKNKNQINININSNNKRVRRRPAQQQPNNTSVILTTPHVPYIQQDSGLNHIYPILQNIHEKVQENSVQPTQLKLNEDQLAYFNDLKRVVDMFDRDVKNNMVEPKKRVFNTPKKYTKQDIPNTDEDNYEDILDTDTNKKEVVVKSKRGRKLGSKNKPKIPESPAK